MTSQNEDGFWYVGTTFATFGVTVKDGKVDPEESAPISRRFAHQPFGNLTGWLGRKDPNLVLERLLEPSERVRERPV